MSGDNLKIRNLEFRVKMLEAFAYSNSNEGLLRQVDQLTIQQERLKKELVRANATIRVLESLVGETQFDEASTEYETNG